MGGGPLKKKDFTTSVKVERARHVLELCIHEAELGALDGGKRIEPAGVAWLRTTFREPFRRKLTEDPKAFPREHDFITGSSYLLGRLAAKNAAGATVNSADLRAALDSIRDKTCNRASRGRFQIIGVWCDIG